MALATLTTTIFPYPKGIDNTQRSQIVRGTFAISANGTYPPGGFPLSWASLTNSNGETIEAIPPQSSTPSSTGTVQPFNVDVKSVAYQTSVFGFGPSGFVYIWDSVNGNLHIFQTETFAATSGVSGPLVEIGGNIPFAVSQDVIQFEAWFARN